MENIKKDINYKSNFLVNHTKLKTHKDRASRTLCKVIKLSSKLSLIENLNQISKLNPNEFPCLFVFVIVVNSLDNFDISQIEKRFFYQFDKTRPIILQIEEESANNSIWFYRPENGNQLIHIKEENSEFKQLSKLLFKFTKNNNQREFDKFIKDLIVNIQNCKSSSTILRFLLTLNLSEDNLLPIMQQCALKGSKSEISSLMNASFENEFRIFNIETQKLLSENVSILLNSITNPKMDIVDYLISNCTHLIQELSYNDRISISNYALQMRKIGTLCDLLEFSDFPFPNNFHVSSVQDDRLQRIINQRKNFHKAISDKNSNKIKDFIINSQNLRFVFNIDNKSALASAMESKSFKIYADLKSHGFKSKENEIDDIKKNFDEKELEDLKAIIWKQTQENVAKARSDNEKIIYHFRSRSHIHKRIILKEVEAENRNKIDEMFKNLNEIPLCSKFLHIASQCLDLKIIFDFDSESVENVDIKSGPHALGTTYPVSKWIFIGAKETLKNHIKKIEGVLMHEISHYVMRLIYENKEKPYFKNDKNARDEFDKICKIMNKWTLSEDNENDESSSENSDDEDEDDECEGIISSVFIDYEEENHHPELIVRPLQILAQFNSKENETKLNVLKIKYNQLFNFIEKFVLPKFKNFNLPARKDIRRLNRLFGDWHKIKKENYQFKNTRNVEKLIKSHFKPIISNIPKLAVCNIFQCIQNQNLPDASIIFVSSETFLKNGVFNEFKSVLSEDKNTTVVVDCSRGLNNYIKELYDLNVKLVVVMANRDQHIALEEMISGQIIIYRKAAEELNYSFEDLTIESQRSVIQKKINFQNNFKLTFEEVITDKRSAKGDVMDEKLFKTFIDDQVLKILLKDVPMSVNVSQKSEDDEKNFAILFQPRNLIKKICKSEEVEVVAEDNLLQNVVNMQNILISDLGGTGKTWMLRRVVNILHKQVPNNWITYVDLKQHIKAFKDQKTKIEFSRFLCEKILKLKNNYEIQIFNLLYKNGRVTILCDGFDEIPQDCAKFVLNFMKLFENNNGNQLWIATRNYCEENLQNEIKLDAIFNLEEFTEENGIDLVINTWLLHDEPNLKGDLKSHPNYSKYKNLVKKLGAKLPKKASRPIGFPLFYKMIANVYVDKKDSIDILTVFEIVENIVKQHCRRWISEKGESGLDAAVESQKSNTGYFKVHQWLAIKSMFPAAEKSFNLLDSNSVSDHKINNCGLATKNGEIICFQHETIREYFVASYVTEILKGPSEQKSENFEALLKDILANFKFSVIRMFINDGLNPNEIRSDDKFIENLINNSECEFLSRVFKEGHTNIIKTFMPLTPEKSSKVLKILSQTINVIIEVVQINEILEEFFQHFISYLTDEDLKNLFYDQEVFQNLVKFRSDITILENVAIMLKIKIGKEIVKKSLTKKCLVNSNIFYSLFDSNFFDENNFKMLFLFLKKYLNSIEIVEMIKQNKNNVKNILHACVVMKKEKKLEILWQEIQYICEGLDNLLSFKNMIIDSGSVLHVISSCNDERFHATLWKLILQTYPNQDEFSKLVLHKDNNGSSFLHLLVKNKNPDTLNCALKHIPEIPIKDVLKLKDQYGKNLLQLCISTSKSDEQIHKVLWNYIEETIPGILTTELKIIKKLLLESYNEQNNVFELMACYSCKNVFKFLIEKIIEILGEEEFIAILKSLNKPNKNLIQIAVINNTNLEFHEELWKILNKYLEPKEMLDIVNSIDVAGNTLLMLAVIHNNQGCAELTWKEISNHVKGKFERHEYLNKNGQDGSSLLELAKGNRHKNVAPWIGDLLNKVTISGHPYGESVNLLQFEGNNAVTINIEKLDSMLNHKEVRNRKIVAFSIVGALRKGKSFFLNYCLRFLYAHYPSINYPNNPVFNKNDWIGAETESLKGFSWRSGFTCDTRGITIWDDVFLHTNETGQKIAIIVIDSQGLFDHETSQQNNLKIFAIGTLISSIQVFNISAQFQLDQLQHLQSAADYAKFPKHENYGTSSKNFQSLVFLVRDWPHQKDFDYGLDGGDKYLKYFFAPSKESQNDLDHIHADVRNSFENISCCLLPPPGINVTVGKKNQPDYDGSYKEMETEFKVELIKVIEQLLSPRNLIIKKLNNEILTSEKYLKYIKIYFEMFYSEQLPKAQTVYESTIEQHLRIVVDSSFDEYKNEIKSKKSLINTIEQIPFFHEMITYKVMHKFRELDKIGNIDLHLKFKEILTSKINENYEKWNKILSKKILLHNSEIQKKTSKMEAEISKLKKEKSEIQELLDNKTQQLVKITQELTAKNSELQKKTWEVENLKSKLS